MSIKKGDKTVAHIYKPKLITRDGEEVERVLYIGSSGTQFIDTGIKFNRSQPTAEMKFKDLTVKGNLFGTYNGYSAWFNGWGLFNNKTVDGCYYVHYKSNQKFSARTEYATVKMDRNKVYIDGSLIITQGVIDSYVCNNTLYMLSGNFGETRKAEIPTLKIEYFKVWKDDVLVRDFVPVKYGTEYCMLDLVENKLYHNKGTGAFSGGDRVEVKKITQILELNNEKYYPLDYIEMNGTQFIGTDIEFNSWNFIWELDVDILQGGSQNGTDTLIIGEQDNATNFLFRNGKNGAVLTPQKISGRQKLKINCSANKVYVGNSEYSITRGSGTGGYLHIGRRNGTSIIYASERIYGSKIWKNGVLVRDFIPVQKQDGTLGMFDLVSNTLFTNAGSGSFIAGNKKEIIMGGD